MNIILKYSAVLVSLSLVGCSVATVNTPNKASSSTSVQGSSSTATSSTSLTSSSSACSGSLNGTTFVDCRDKQTYTYVTIGTQIWMAQNLNYGTLIPSDSAQNNNEVTEKYCYNDLESNCKIYGALYQWNEAANWPVATSSSSATLTGVCPAGWHIPTTAEVNILTAYAGGSLAATVLKSSHYWNTASGTDADHFAFLPAGDRKYYTTGGFEKLGSVGYIWTATATSTTTAYDIEMDDNLTTVSQVSSNTAYGLSVRCLRN